MREVELRFQRVPRGNNARFNGNNAVVRGNNALMARPTYRITEKMRKMVKTMASLGCRHEDIAKIMEMTPKTLRKHFRSELDTGAIEANSKVVQSLFEMATKGKNPSAAIFWAKARCGWRERPRESDAPAEASQIIVKVD